ncbi:hypothetical protein [Rhodovulum sp. YEN HP10]|uniref:hypothetical protein n=1 Tax=Rhodovulum sp. HP10 TaxID=3387397 RepID=UPI0039E00A49
MQKDKKTLSLPREWEVLLQTQLTTDGKVDQLLPLISLLDDPEHPMSELGQALVDALQRISEDLREATSLRIAHRAALEQASAANTTMLQIIKDTSQELHKIRAENHTLRRQIDEIHGLMFSPAD